LAISGFSLRWFNKLLAYSLRTSRAESVTCCARLVSKRFIGSFLIAHIFQFLGCKWFGDLERLAVNIDLALHCLPRLRAILAIHGHHRSQSLIGDRGIDFVDL